MLRSVSFVVLCVTCLSAGCRPQPSVNSLEAPPDAVWQAFREKFPTVERPEWKLKSDKNYEAEFTLGETEIAAKFDQAGKWLETESSISPDQVPQAVRDSAAKQFSGYNFVETQSIERPKDQGLSYELHLDNGQEIVKVQFSSDGAVLNQSTKPKDRASPNPGVGM
jgi:Putative beta-lactamase-inhibitor-like, PepSY-like